MAQGRRGVGGGAAVATLSNIDANQPPIPDVLGSVCFGLGCLVHHPVGLSSGWVLACGGERLAGEVAPAWHVGASASKAYDRRWGVVLGGVHTAGGRRVCI